MRKACLYIRVSTDEQADKGYSQRDQEERLRRHCQSQSIEIDEVIIEDYSAKTFERPAWRRLLAHLRKSRQPRLVLFTKWDRFSRNTGDAYQMISLLGKLGAEPQAIEQPLDLSIPENKMMLAVYLAAPEVENDRRALNVFHGMRRAKKEGRWMATAPIGYINRITPEGKKHIAPHPVNAPIMVEVFEQIAAGTYNTEQIWKMARHKGLRSSKNNFWVAIRNPVYCGKIFIPPYKDEAGYFVKGVHEIIISESLFDQAQQSLDGRKRNPNQKPKIRSLDDLPLRGFLKCPKCSRMLTGSASKGNGGYYYYYHCSVACKVRFKAQVANERLVHELRELIPRPGRIEIFTQAIMDDFKQKVKHQETERKQILSELDSISIRMQKARIMKVDGDLEEYDFKMIKEQSARKTEELEKKLNSLQGRDKEISVLLEKALKNLSGLDLLYENGNIEEKRKILGSIFPEKLTFDGVQHRTTRINELLNLIYQKNSELYGNKKGTNLLFLDLSHQVIPLGFEPRTHTLKVYCSTS